MPTKIRIITNSISEGAAALGEKLKELGANVSRVRIGGSSKRVVRNNIKWGCFPMVPADFGGPILNVSACDVSLNKLTCLSALHGAGVPVPEFTTSVAEAAGWFTGVRAGRMRVYERHSLRGSEGTGIRVVESANNLLPAPLYVKGMRGVRREYRIHVFMLNGVRRVFIQQKKRRTGFADSENYNNTIRNLASGWIFAHNSITAPRQQTIDIAVASCTTFGLTFGAVDVIEMHDVSQGSVVLEINCAPGLMGATCEFYAHAINDSLNGVVDASPNPEVAHDEEPDRDAYGNPDDDYDDTDEEPEVAY